MADLTVKDVIEKLRLSYATIIRLIDECITNNREKRYFIDREYRIVDYTVNPLGVILVHLKPHLERDERVLIIGEAAQIYEPSVLELKQFYHSSYLILGVCCKVGVNYWMNLLVKTRIARRGTTCDYDFVFLGGP